MDSKSTSGPITKFRKIDHSLFSRRMQATIGAQESQLKERGKNGKKCGQREEKEAYNDYLIVIMISHYFITIAIFAITMFTITIFSFYFFLFRL